MKKPRMQNRRTPRWFFHELDRLFGPFELDAFAEPHNALCPRWYTAREDGTRAPWRDVTFANPPFALMEEAVAHALEQAERHDVRSITIAPIGGAQRWYHEYAVRGTIYVPTTRVNYDLPDGSPTDGADRDSMVIAFGREHYNRRWRRGEFRVRRLDLARAAA